MSNTQSTETAMESTADTDTDTDIDTAASAEVVAAADEGKLKEAGDPVTTQKPKRKTGASQQPEVTINPASFADLHPQPNGNREKASLDMLLDIGLQVTVELGRTKMNIRDVLSVGPGTVVELNRVAGEPVDILINGKPIAKGEVVVIGDMFGVRVTDILPPALRVQNMM